nr:hypothetical protein [uncultured Anaeromusa sp.]
MQKSKVVVYNANKIRTEKSESIVNVDAESTVKLGESKDRIRKGSDKGKKSFVMQGSRNIA